MKIMRLGNFINTHMEEILREWEAFATTIVPPALTMDSKALRNHAKLMLQAIALDLGNDQSAEQQTRKSHGLGRLLEEESSAETHAAARLFSGFTIEQLISEYRALRASVLRLWAAHAMDGRHTDAADITRFNEAIDQAVAESVVRYSQMVTKSQHLFLAILGHDLRNPLATTLMASRFIMEASEADSKCATAANRIHHAGQRMNTLVNDLIDYTRTNLGSSLPIILKAVDLENLCRDAIAEQELAHPGRRFQLISTGACHGHWDDNRIAQVLSNLLGNAVQHGSSAETIVVRLQPGKDEIVLCVENRGKVIPVENLNAVFEPLVRLANADDQAGEPGTSLGIGLYIAKEIVRAHGGAIAVTSDEQEGTRFAITLPRAPRGNVAQTWTAPVP
ncbi:MAG TPA: sensor histidine kinase [Telluria sp.]|jgi:signal transduction histidine kinase